MAEDPVSVATFLAAATALLGGYAALGFLLGRALPMQRSVTGLHGLGAAAVLAVLLRAELSGLTPAAGSGPDFVTIGLWLLVPAAGLGLAALASRRAKRPLRGLAIGAHAGVAIFGLTVLLAAAAL